MGGARASQGFARGTPANIRRFGNTYATATVAQKRNRTQYGYTGNGMYTGQGAYRGRGAYSIGSLFKAASPYAKIAAEAGGRALLNSVPYGGAIRTGLNALGYRGMGAYSREGVSNDLVMGKGSAPTASGVPHFQTFPGEDGALLVSYREYLGDVFGSNVGNHFQLNSIPLNPGLETSFPWLSQIASNFKEYEWKQCVFDFRSMITDMQTTNGQLGQIVMTSEYNVDSFPYEDKNDMLTTVHAISGKVIDDITAGVECDPKKLSGAPGKYIRTRPVLIGEDKKEYDLANFQYAVCDTPDVLANLPLGQLYVSYTVVLRKARTYSARGNMISRFIGAGALAGTQVAVAAADNHLVENPLGTTLGARLGNAVKFLTGQQNNFPIALRSCCASTFKSLGDMATLNGDDSSSGVATTYRIGSRLKQLTTGLPVSDRNNPWYIDPATGVTAVTPNLTTWYATFRNAGVSNMLVFPASYSGVVRVLIHIEASLVSGGVSTAVATVQAPLLLGNISCVNDMVAASMTPETSSEGDAPACFNRNADALTANRKTYSMLIHVRVRPASDGIDNALVWSDVGRLTNTSALTGPASLGGGTCMLACSGTGGIVDQVAIIHQSSVDVQEYNGSFAQSPVLAMPAYVDDQGVVVAPF